ncbi:uncharacterized protein LOC122551066 [Chiloscyllium plagiosum]|uniref:uncharacterized protein LOC122551066 n=1 Tax=Chiloscyllium plagiosum TaxID=36176 RepID=UPI001CB88379|nr:uncharacterized protein LOC122551066 [Chiloscyllium plagiosum]
MCLETLACTSEEDCLTGCEQERLYKINKTESNDPKGDSGQCLENESPSSLVHEDGPLKLCTVSKHPSRNTEVDEGCHYRVMPHLAEWNLESGDEEMECASILEVASSNSSLHKNTRNAASSLSKQKVEKFRSSIILFSDSGSQTETVPTEMTELCICEASDELYAPEDNFIELPHNVGYFMRKGKQAINGKQNCSLPTEKTSLWQLGKHAEKVRIPEEYNSLKQEETGKGELRSEDVFHWSDSMSLLMRKLDQLNMDIEDALSSSSSPASTPATKRRQDFQQPALLLKLSQETAEIEAKEACDWLRAAGFPQYAQLYEDSQFPIDIASVKKDHDFLDKDFMEPLCRRLNTLNKCTSMKIDVNLPKKKVRIYLLINLLFSSVASGNVW